MIALGCKGNHKNTTVTTVLVKELLREMILAKQPILYIFRFSWPAAAMRPGTGG